ncbi:uncharacterized protein RMCC_2460 [Mycolicibacterium canariasense]|uniref:DUF4326 domain-containing protein n=2 Tax=Mycolicibacterium canariasense TaxID=228230 RepID=A0A117I9Z1_MYCCR|nr:DUF4326 domain-containing protein [Mycolicibacterium canariasense]GAS95494.1 uncharacterized protein RMCC_2460 [Mycolicibacterium canariasense]
MPEGAVYVGRPSKWGNEFNWQSYRKYPPSYYMDGEMRDPDDMRRIPDAERRRLAVVDFKDMLRRAPLGDGQWGRKGESVYDTIRRELAGRDLVCWCPLDQPCHGDVLLELANGGGA